jgi:hypothetical protein
MENVTFIEVETIAGAETHAIIDHGNEQFTSMPKSEYDRRQAEAEQSTPSLENGTIS